MSRRPTAVVFDVVETLFSLEPLQDRLRAAGLPGEALEGWFAGFLRDGLALDATGVYQPFKEVAVGTLLGVLAEHGLQPDRGVAENVVKGFAELPAHPDVAPALQRLRKAGVRVATLTNGGAEATRALLERAGLEELVERVISVEEVRHWKPRREVYRHAARILGVEPGSLALIAAHAWDTHGAARAGLVAGFVARKGEPFPASMTPPDVTGATLEEVVLALMALPGA